MVVSFLRVLSDFHIEDMLNPSCTKVFGSHTLYEGEIDPPPPPPPMISKTVDPTEFNFGRPLGISMGVKNMVELMI